MAQHLFEALNDGVDYLSSREYLEEAHTLDDIKMRAIVRQHLPNLNITRVCTVRNKYLKTMYALKKEEYKSRSGSVSELVLFHATSESNVNSIIKNNLDWRRVTRSKFGKGVSFSDDADYANFHSNCQNGVERAFIIANVLVSKRCMGSQNMTVPCGDADTAIGNDKVFVKFYDNEFCPTHVVYYNAPDRKSSKFYRAPRFRRRW